jgi:hypothetical protein
MGTAAVDRGELKQWAIAIVSEVSPEDVFVVEDGFDELMENWTSSQSQDEGRFIGGHEIAHFAAIVGPFLLGFLTDVTKDVAKDQAKKLVERALGKLRTRQATTEDRAELTRELKAAVARARYSDAQKKVLLEGFDKLVRKVTQTKQR